jgi:hypothetical protein
MGDINYFSIFKALGGVKVGFCLLIFFAAIILLCCAVLTEDGFVYLTTLALITGVGGNLAGMGIHAFGKNQQGK